ncbi:MAG: hypothetical protein PHU61_01490 [Candidatus Absconditabacteria bacterium]|nr:hypothetical protein [Candidatus Absconditabacteria bacterium]MDD3868027.1 hypothetical protein [Candidatus Absconditabacteria bacterium]MDD4714274.1 hypothetical protein [Candidatus Absconditabacteria bacterium]
MLQYFDMLLDFLSVEGKEKFLEIASYLEQYPQKNLMLYHRLGFAFQAFSDLLHTHISVEEFLSAGDISSTTPLLLQASDSSWHFLETLSEENTFAEGSILILDAVSFLALSQEQQGQAKHIFESSNLSVFIC